MRKIKTFNKQNIAKEVNKSGYYIFYNKSGKKEYVGSSTQIKHRLQSYYQKDDFTVNRTKRNLRPHIKYYVVFYCSITQARKKEKELKQGTPHNKK